MGGTPFPDGWEPDDDRDRGGMDEEFASVVFDEDFVRAAVVHEPTAVERLLAAAEARAAAQEAEARRAHSRGVRGDDDRYDDGYGPDFGHRRDDDPDDFDDAEILEDRYGPDGPYGRPYDKQTRWHRREPAARHQRRGTEPPDRAVRLRGLLPAGGLRGSPQALTRPP